jgi:hypothetical protein
MGKEKKRKEILLKIVSFTIMIDKSISAHTYTWNFGNYFGTEKNIRMKIEAHFLIHMK